ncbi:MAG: hypothetical protein AB1753_09435 [Thermoproteota archaeon]
MTDLMSPTSNNMTMVSKRYVLMALAIAAGAALLAGTAMSTMAAKEDRVATDVGKSRRHMDYKNGVFKVRAGGGGSVAPLTQFYPPVANIKVGETVVWYNPTRVAEPHTVTFFKDPAMFAPIEQPYLISNSTAVKPLAPGNSDAFTFPGPQGATAMLGANARAYNVAVIDGDGKASYLPPNTQYAMRGSEQYLNSGFIWPEGQAPEGLPPVTSFSVKFEQAGTYDYVCAIHPWMTGQVVVK